MGILLAGIFLSAANCAIERDGLLFCGDAAGDGTGAAGTVVAVCGVVVDTGLVAVVGACLSCVLEDGFDMVLG